jgi:Transposase DDE domain
VALTPDDVGDVSEIPALLDQIDAEIALMTADGVYDGEAVYDAVAEHDGHHSTAGNIGCR